jgi:hypothetical protein
MHGPTYVFWANLTPLSRQTMERRQAEEIVLMRKELDRRDWPCASLPLSAHLH